MYSNPKSFWQISFGVFIILSAFAGPGYSEHSGGLEIIPHASLRESYDDNVTYVKDDPVSDMITNLLFGVGIKQEGKTHSLLLDASVQHELFIDNPSFNNTAEDLGVRFKKEFSKYDRLEIVDKLTHADEPRSFEDAFGRTAGRYSSLINQTGLSFTHDFTQRFSGEAHYGNAAHYYSREDLDDAFLHQVGIKISYAHDSATSFNVTYDFIRRFFESGADATVNSAGLGMRRYFTSQFYMDLLAGPDFINSFNGQDYIKPHYSAALTNEVNENNRISLTFDKQHTTNAYTQDLFDSWRTAVNFSRKISQRLNGSISIFYGNGHYENSDASENLQGVKTQLDYAINKKINLGIGYSFTNADSSNSGNEYRRNYVYLSTRIIF